MSDEVANFQNNRQDQLSRQWKKTSPNARLSPVISARAASTEPKPRPRPSDADPKHSTDHDAFDLRSTANTIAKTIERGGTDLKKHFTEDEKAVFSDIFSEKRKLFSAQNILFLLGMFGAGYGIAQYQNKQKLSTASKPALQS